MRAALLYGNGGNIVPFSGSNAVASVAIPNAIASTATAVMLGYRAGVRSPNVKSRRDTNQKRCRI